MKTGIFIAALLQLAAAQPHHAHKHQHENRAEVDVVVTKTATDVVYVNAQGQHVHAPAGAHVAAPSHVAAPAPAPVKVKAHTHARPKVAHKKVSHDIPVKQPIVKAPSIKTTVPDEPSNKGAHGNGITYTPYLPGACKTAAQMQADVEQIAAAGYTKIRLYNTDCNQIQIVSEAAKCHDMLLFPTILDFSNVAGQMQEIAEGVGKNWSHVHSIGIGNEMVNQGLATPAQVGQAVDLARSTLSNLGYNGFVVAPEVFDQFTNNPELCGYSDWIAANAHAFFDADCTPSQAGTIVRGYHDSLVKTCGGKTTRITESGWPSGGENNNLAKAGWPHHQVAIASLKSSFSDIPGQLFLFSAYNATNEAPGAYDDQQTWGILG